MFILWFRMLYVSDTTLWCCMEVEQYNFGRDMLNSLISAAGCAIWSPSKSHLRSLDWSFFGDPSGTGNRWKLTYPLKKDGWKTIFLLNSFLFIGDMGYVNFLGGYCSSISWTLVFFRQDTWISKPRRQFHPDFGDFWTGNMQWTHLRKKGTGNISRLGRQFNSKKNRIYTCETATCGYLAQFWGRYWYVYICV